jgi:hypothetical protein
VLLRTRGGFMPRHTWTAQFVPGTRGRALWCARLLPATRDGSALVCVSSSLAFPQLSLLPSSCLVPLSCRHTHVYCVCVCMSVRAHTTSGRQGFLLKLWVFVQSALHIRTCIGGHSRCSKWGRSALSCAFSMRMLFVPLPNSKPSAEGRTEHPRVT